VYKVIIIGARGYTGAELLPLLYRHSEFEIVAVGSTSTFGQPVNAHISGLEGCELVFSEIRPVTLEQYEVDACVLALPNGLAAEYVKTLDRHSPATVIVDLSADHRFDSAWAYGQPELYGDQLMKAMTVPSARSLTSKVPTRLRTLT